MFNAGGIPSIVTEGAYQDSAYDPTDLSTYTLSSMGIGAAHPYRYVVVGVGFLDLSSGMSAVDGPTSVTIGGVSATLINKASEFNGAGHLTGASLWIAKVPTGTTADVVVNFSEAVGSCQVMTYRLLSTTGTLTSLDDVQVTSSPATTGTLKNWAIGIAYAAVRDNTTPVGVGWAGTASPVEDNEHTETYNAFAMASFTDPGTVQAEWAGANTIALVAATWR